MKKTTIILGLTCIATGSLFAQIASAQGQPIVKSDIGVDICFRQVKQKAARPEDRAKSVTTEFTRFVVAGAKCPRGFAKIATVATPESVENITQNYINQNPSALAGPQGPQGPQGLQGAQGLPGVQGAQGLQGAPGINGSRGADGAPGRDGVDGKDADMTLVNNLDVRVSATENYNTTVVQPAINSHDSRLSSLEVYNANTTIPAVNSLQSRVGSLETYNSDTTIPAINNLQSRLGAVETYNANTAIPAVNNLQTRVGSLETYNSETTVPAISNLQSRLGAVETYNTSTAIPAVDSLKTRVTALESYNSGTSIPAVTNLQTRLGAVENYNANTTIPAVNNIQARLGSLETYNAGTTIPAVVNLQTRVGALETYNADTTIPAVVNLQERVVALEGGGGVINQLTSPNSGITIGQVFAEPSQVNGLGVDAGTGFPCVTPADFASVHPDNVSEQNGRVENMEPGTYMVTVFGRIGADSSSQFKFSGLGGWYEKVVGARSTNAADSGPFSIQFYAKVGDAKTLKLIRSCRTDTLTDESESIFGILYHKIG